MKEKVLDMKKRITRLSDDFVWLTTEKRNELKQLQAAYTPLLKELDASDNDWIDEQYGVWYEKYLHNETVGNMRLPEG